MGGEVYLRIGGKNEDLKGEIKVRQAYQPIKQRELKAGGRARVVGRTSPHCFREGGIVEVKGYDRVYGGREEG